MRKTLLAIAFMLTALTVQAKENQALNPKYGKGAVTTDSNGMVCFADTVAIPDGMDADKCFMILDNWAKGHFTKPFANAGRFLSEDAASRRLVMHVDQTLVFKSTAMVADESDMTYNFSVVVKDNCFILKMTDIKYAYETKREHGGQKFTAEEWITDKEAYNKKGTKFLRTTGKFRVKTIDLKERLFNTAVQAVDDNK